MALNNLQVDEDGFPLESTNVKVDEDGFYRISSDDE